MKREKKDIELKDVPALFMQCQMLVKAADPIVEKITCAFKYKDDSVIYMYPLLDWLDLPQEREYIKFTIYQMVEE